MRLPVLPILLSFFHRKFLTSYLIDLKKCTIGNLLLKLWRTTKLLTNRDTWLISSSLRKETSPLILMETLLSNIKKGTFTLLITLLDQIFQKKHLPYRSGHFSYKLGFLCHQWNQLSNMNCTLEACLTPIIWMEDLVHFSIKLSGH